MPSKPAFPANRRFLRVYRAIIPARQTRTNLFSRDHRTGSNPPQTRTPRATARSGIERLRAGIVAPVRDLPPGPRVPLLSSVSIIPYLDVRRISRKT